MMDKRVVGYSGVELPVEESVYDDNANFLNKDSVEEAFRQGFFSSLTVEQQNSIRVGVGLKPFDTTIKNVLKPKG